MQLFSRKKALIAVSLSALAALGACGDNVTVPVAPAAPVVISITPPSASLNVGESLNFAVQISGGSTTAVPTLASCTSSSATVATATVSGNACRVTAVAAGNATITAAASTGQVAAAAVVVSAPPPAINSLAVSPSAAQLAIGQSVTLVPTVQPAGRTVAYTYATSSAAIATVSAAGVVAAIAPGVATITVTANGTGTGFAPATISQAVTITVSDRVPGLTALNVQPNSLSLALAQTSTLVASAVGPSSATAAITFGTNNPAVATVGATSGVVTAVAPGTAVITVTATSAQNGAFAASTITALIPVTVSQGAQVSIANITYSQSNSPIDLSNTSGQIQVQLNVTPNGQNVQSAQVYICDRGQTPCPAAGQDIAAQQSFTQQGGNLATINLLINTAEFDLPNFTTGDNARTHYKNGLKTIIATLNVGQNTVASNNISNINFNNTDGYAVQWNRPANRTLGSNAITYYGGPDTPDAAVAGAQPGFGSFVVVPVLYTPGLDIRQVSLALNNITNINSTPTAGGANACSSTPITDSIRPFGIRFGAGSRQSDNFAATPLYLSCAGYETTVTTTQLSPIVTSSVDNKNDPGPIANFINPNPPLNAGGFAGTIDFKLGTFYRPTVSQGYESIAADWAAPSITRLSVKGGGGSGAQLDSGWVNAAYAFNSGAGLPSSGATLNDNAGGLGCPVTGASNSRYCITDAGVNLLVTRNTRFDVYAISQRSATTFQFAGQTPVATGPLASTVSTLGLGESSADFTNSAYVLIASETDRLGNRRTTVPFEDPTVTGTQQYPVDANNSLNNAAFFGVDLTAPVVVSLPNNPAQGGPNGFIAGYAKTDVDSIYSTLGATYGAVDANAAVFAYRFTDSRSGFTSCVPATVGPDSWARANRTLGTCPSFAANAPTQVNAGTFQVVRRSAPATVSVLNDAVVENLVQSSADGSATAAPTRILSTINAVTNPNDNSQRDFSINIFSAANRYSASLTTQPLLPIAAATAGYYTFSGTLMDRAGNTTTLTPRSVAIDNAAPQITGIVVPGVLTGGTTVNFGPAGTDDLEAIAGDLGLRYQQLGVTDGTQAFVQGALPTVIRFARVPHFTSTPLLGLWHNPFQSLTDNKLTTPVGPGTLLAASGLNVPIPFIQQIQTVAANTAPIAAGGLGSAAIKPDSVLARLYDIRATASATAPAFAVDSGRSTQLQQPIFPQQVTQPATAKNWTNAGAGNVGINFWDAFNPAGSSGTIEYRVETSTSITNPPFTAVYVIRHNPANSEWQFLGTATAIGSLDQGGLRFWRYTFTYAGQSQGIGSLAAFANGDQIRAIGVDAAGNGLSTITRTLGLANAIPAGVTINTVTVFPAVAPFLTIADGANATTGAITLSADPNLTNKSYTCVSSNPAFVTASLAGNVCTLTAAGTIISNLDVQITLTVTGSVNGFNTNTVSRTVTVTRIP